LMTAVGIAFARYGHIDSAAKYHNCISSSLCLYCRIQFRIFLQIEFGSQGMCWQKVICHVGLSEKFSKLCISLIVVWLSISDIVESHVESSYIWAEPCLIHMTHSGEIRRLPRVRHHEIWIFNPCAYKLFSTWSPYIYSYFHKKRNVSFEKPFLSAIF
jgi:hypothetical protein